MTSFHSRFPEPSTVPIVAEKSSAMKKDTCSKRTIIGDRRCTKPQITGCASKRQHLKRCLLSGCKLSAPVSVWLRSA